MNAGDYSVLIVWSNEDEAFLAQVLELPGCVADGATREEALENAKIAAQNWIDTAKEIGREIPDRVPFEHFERPINSEAQLQRAVQSELEKIIPELMMRVESRLISRMRTVLAPEAQSGPALLLTQRAEDNARSLEGLVAKSQREITTRTLKHPVVPKSKSVS